MLWDGGFGMPDGSQIAPRARDSLLNLPNIITFGRLCAVPVAVGLVLNAHPLAAFWLFAAAGLSDAVDGWLARRQGPTLVGAMLDPVADKALLVSMYITLAVVHVLPDWLAIMVVFRDLVIVGGVLLLVVTGPGVAIKPLFISKLNTTLQILLVATALLMAGLPETAATLFATFDLAPGVVFGLLVGAVAASTLASGAAYVWNTVRTR